MAFDYLFINDKGAFTKEELKAAGDDEASGIKVLVVKDYKSKCTFGHVVPSKGIDVKRFSVDMIIEDITWLGYTKLILKADNEPAMVKLAEEALRDLRVEPIEQVMKEHPPPFDSQANGQIEVGVESVRGMVKTIQLCLEKRLGHRIPVAHPIMSWLVSHAAVLSNYSVLGQDGRTPYHRVRGRPWGARLMSFGECCRFKIRSKEGLDTDSSGNRFSKGIVLGFCIRDGQYTIFSGG